MSDPTLQQNADVLTLKADGLYGLSEINQRQHALEASSSRSRPVARSLASLLHDIGHLVHDPGDNLAEAGVDEPHEERGHQFLAAWFGP